LRFEAICAAILRSCGEKKCCSAAVKVKGKVKAKAKVRGERLEVRGERQGKYQMSKFKIQMTNDGVRTTSTDTDHEHESKCQRGKRGGGPRLRLKARGWR